MARKEENSLTENIPELKAMKIAVDIPSDMIEVCKEAKELNIVECRWENMEFTRADFIKDKMLIGHRLR